MYQFFDTLTDDSGNSLLGATVTVANYPSLTAATIYSSNGTTSPIAGSTVIADITGQVSFFAPDGSYQLTYVYKGTTYKTRVPVQFLDPMGFVALPDTGAVNALVITNGSLPGTLYAGLKLELTIKVTNTGATTLVFQGGAAQNVVQPGGSALVAGLLQANGIARFEYDGTNWQLMATQSQPFYPTVLAETQISVVPVNNSYPVCHEYRYGNNTVPGTTDMSAAINAACSVSRNSGGIPVQIPIYEKQLVSASINIINCHIQGIGNPWIGPGIQANGNQFDILTLTQVGGFAFVLIENLYVDGGNPGGATAGLLGDTLSLKKTSPDHPYVATIQNCSFVNNKQRGIYYERGGYTTTFHVRVVGNGLHALEISAASSADLATSFHDYGSSQFGGCPRGYGIKLTEAASCSFNDSILEDTWGISLNGTDNRTLSFQGVYQENFTVTNPTGNFFNDSSGGIGFRYGGLFGGNLNLGAPANTAFLPNWLDVYDNGGNSNLGNAGCSLQNRVISGASGQVTNAVTGAQSVTVTSVSLPPGNWLVFGTLQCANAGSANLQDFGMTVTTNIADVGTGSSTATLTLLADRVEASPPTGTGSTVRLNGAAFFQNLTTGNVTYYMRSFINNSAGTLAYNGQITAIKYA